MTHQDQSSTLPLNHCIEPISLGSRILFDLIIFSTLLRVGGDEGADRGGTNTGVDTRSVGLSATITPGNETNEGLGGVDNGASRVTLARVLSTLGKTSTEHVGGDLVAGVDGLILRGTSGAGNYRDADLAESGRKRRSARGSGSPGSESVSCARK